MTGYTGGCQCGAVRYTWSTKRITAYACHCRECQKQSASAFAISVPAWARDLDVSGPLQAYERGTDSGSTTNCWFCQTCGTRIYHQSARSSEMVTLKGGTLDNALELQPVAHLWVSRQHRWVRLAPDAVTFNTQPDDLKSWRDALLDQA
ncbi:MAG: GFA family protein [Hyphomicrobiaceae bacterium]